MIQTSSAASGRTPTGASPAAASDSVLVVASFWRASMIDCSTWISYGMDVAFCVLSNWPITTKLSAWVVAVESKYTEVSNHFYFFTIKHLHLFAGAFGYFAFDKMVFRPSSFARLGLIQGGSCVYFTFYI